MSVTMALQVAGVSHPRADPGRRVGFAGLGAEPQLRAWGNLQTVNTVEPRFLGRGASGSFLWFILVQKLFLQVKKKRKGPFLPALYGQERSMPVID